MEVFKIRNKYVCKQFLTEIISLKKTLAFQNVRSTTNDCFIYIKHD